MAMARITSKGQVTIPAPVRRRLGVEEGDSILFEQLAGGEFRVRAVKRRDITTLFASLAGERGFPGKAAVRDEAGRALGAEDAAESGRP